MASSKDRSLADVVLVLIGAAAGLAVFLSFIGAVVTWGRFRTLDLPSEAASATLSQSTLLVVGVKASVTLLALGLVAAALAYLARKIVNHCASVSAEDTDEAEARGGEEAERSNEALKIWWWYLAGALCVLFPTLLVGFFDIWHVARYIALVGLIVLGSLLPWSRSKVGARAVAYISFGLAVVAALVVLVWDIWKPPTNLERAELVLSNGESVDGFWIAETSTTFYLAPQVDGREGPCQVTGEVLAFPREDVASIHFSPRVSVWSIHREPKPDPCGD